MATSLATEEQPPQLFDCPVDAFEDSTVDILIDPNTRQWIAELVDGLFAPEQAEIIKKIPLGRAASEDVLFWPYSSNGKYNCKTRYRFLKEEAQLGAAHVSSNWDKHVWNGIWFLRVPRN